ncbi:hypothetical protein PflQ8_0325 [Pseudomonas fluorescens Q8r1-96]|nr:hypothetical protein PflQ8_0325 [Pseudomonas fluorescens Q8r1-96]
MIKSAGRDGSAFFVSAGFRIHTNPCGSELARDSGGSTTLLLTDTLPSRASSLPQGVVFKFSGNSTDPRNRLKAIPAFFRSPPEATLLSSNPDG